MSSRDLLGTTPVLKAYLGPSFDRIEKPPTSEAAPTRYDHPESRDVKQEYSSKDGKKARLPSLSDHEIYFPIWRQNHISVIQYFGSNCSLKQADQGFQTFGLAHPTLVASLEGYAGRGEAYRGHMPVERERFTHN